jgi:hypothetical protein
MLVAKEYKKQKIGYVYLSKKKKKRNKVLIKKGLKLINFSFLKYCESEALL